MNWRTNFDLRGLNHWLIGAALGWNLLADFVLLIIIFQILDIGQNGIQMAQIVLILGVCLIGRFYRWPDSR
jgi:hypothetical protein